MTQHAHTEPADARDTADVRRRSDLMRSFLDAHRLVWDMPCLLRLHPEILMHLEARYAVHASDRLDRVSVVTVSDRSRPWTQTLELADLRDVVLRLLERELALALEAEERAAFRPTVFDRVAG
ncbi:MAG: hypothetical protein CMH83_15280 [Nocardioides sp.]|nr:hypothetical protein [Nocardioides sp.]